MIEFFQQFHKFLPKMAKKGNARNLLDSIHVRLFSKHSGPLTIFDVGANKGQSVKRFRNLFPNSIIHCFEPDIRNFFELSKLYQNDSTTFLNNVALGQNAEKRLFYSNKMPGTSSFLPINKNSNWAKRKAEKLNASVENLIEDQYTVDIMALDDYAYDRSVPKINILKLDTQGFELEVILGCASSIKNKVIDVVETELIVGDVYYKSLNFRDLENILLPNGFVFVAIDTSKGCDILSTPHLFFNLIYVRRDFLDQLLSYE